MRVPGAGHLRQRVALTVINETPNAEMGTDSQYGVPVMLWARVDPVVGAAYLGSAQIDKTVTHRFTIRTQSFEITTRHVVEWKSKRFRVRRSSPMIGFDKFTVIEAEELRAI